MKVTKPATASATAEALTPNRTVPLAQIINSKELTYRPLDAAHVDSLFEDIKVNGLDVPLITFNPPGVEQVKIKGTDHPIPTTYLVAGLHRREALRKLLREEPKTFSKLFPNDEVPVNHKVMSVQNALFMQLRENVQRKDMTAEEIFPVLEKLVAEPYNLPNKEIAKRIGKSQAWVSQMLAVNEELDEETKEEVVKGDIAVGDARQLAGKVRADRKAGKTVSKDAIRSEAAKLKEKQATKNATGSQRASGDDRRVSPRKMWQRVEAMPQLPLGRQVLVLREGIKYLAGETDKLPPELKKEIKPSKVEVKKPAAKK